MIGPQIGAMAENTGPAGDVGHTAEPWMELEPEDFLLFISLAG